MAEERIRVTIDRAELDRFRAEVRNLRSETTNTTSGARTLSRELKSIREQAVASGVNLDDLPTLNREMRIIGRLFPGFTEGSRGLFNLRRMVRGGESQRIADALRDFEITDELIEEIGLPRERIQQRINEIIAEEALKATLTKVAIAAVVITIVAQAINRERQRVIRKQSQFEDFIRRDTELTHRQFRELQAEQVGFAHWFDQFQSQVEDEGWLLSIADLVIDKLRSQAYILPKGGKYVAASHVDPGQ